MAWELPCRVKSREWECHVRQGEGSGSVLSGRGRGVEVSCQAGEGSGSVMSVVFVEHADITQVEGAVLCAPGLT